MVSEPFLGTITITETHAKSMEESVKKLENQFQNYMTETNKKLESNISKMDELHCKLNMMMEKFFANKDGILGSGTVERHPSKTLGSRVRMMDSQDNSNGRSYNHFTRSKVECPYSEEGEPQSWLQKCERYFRYHHIVDAKKN